MPRIRCGIWGGIRSFLPRLGLRLGSLDLDVTAIPEDVAPVEPSAERIPENTPMTVCAKSAVYRTPLESVRLSRIKSPPRLSEFARHRGERNSKKSGPAR